MPSAIYHVHSPEDQWARMWTNCDLDREIALCGKRELAAHVLPVLRMFDNPRVVEAGCGVGSWVLYLQQQGFNNIIGVDNYVPALKQLEARGGRAVDGDIRSLPFDDNSVDVCLSLGVVEHFPEGPDALLREMARILVPGGYMFVTVPYYNPIRRLAIHPLRSTYIRLKRMQQRFNEYRFGDREFSGLCRTAGFEVLRCTTDDYVPNNLSLGLHTDFPFLRSGTFGELNKLGAIMCGALRSLNPWLISGGVLVIARKLESK
jgi:SAM-dependent methyltransferase